jgi:hypothetical protein
VSRWADLRPAILGWHTVHALVPLNSQRVAGIRRLQRTITESNGRGSRSKKFPFPAVETSPAAISSAATRPPASVPAHRGAPDRTLASAACARPRPPRCAAATPPNASTGSLQVPHVRPGGVEYGLRLEPLVKSRTTRSDQPLSPNSQMFPHIHLHPLAP